MGRRRSRVLFSAALFVVMTAFPVFSEGIKVVEEGSPASVVVVSDTPSPMAQYAAEEFVLHVEKATGACLEVFGESDVPDGTGARIFIGVTDAARAAGIDPEELGPDEFVLRTGEDRLFIIGREKMDLDPLNEYQSCSGTLFGVYEVLERALEVRWLWPGEGGTHVPRAETVSIPDWDERMSPALEFRQIRWIPVQRAAGWRKRGGIPVEEQREPGWAEGGYDGEGYAPAIGDSDWKHWGFTAEGLRNYGRDLAVYLRRHRMGGLDRQPPRTHYFSGWWEKYGEDHPEWFMLREDGERGPADPESGLGRPWTDPRHVAMCISNPELQQYIVDHAWDGGPYLELGESDRRNWCHCEDCQAWDDPLPEDPFHLAVRNYDPSLSNRYARFWQEIAEKARVRNPDVTITVLLYINYVSAPTAPDLDLGPRIFGDFVGGWHEDPVTFFPMTPEADQWQREQWLGWKDLGVRLSFRPNYAVIGYGYVWPMLSTSQLGDFIRFCYEHGMVGVDLDLKPGQWASQGPMLYMQMRLFSDPTLSVEEALQEYFSAFGPAAPYVESYWDFWEDYSIELVQRVHGDERYHLHGRPHIRRLWNLITNPVEFYPAEVMGQGRALLDRAGEAVDEESEYRDRLDFLEAGLDHADLALAFWDAVRSDADLDVQLDALRALIEFRRAHEHLYISDYLSVTRAVEHRRAGHLIDKLKQEDP